MGIKWLLLLTVILGFDASSQDPFHQRTTAAVKAHQVSKKYRYHGFLKVNQRVFGIVKMVGAEYELLHLGMHKGLGQVMIIEANRICIQKSRKSYCLQRSDTPTVWEAIHA